LSAGGAAEGTTGAVKRGAAEGLEENSGRRTGRWVGEGKRNAGEQENRKGRKREQQADHQQTHRKKKSSTEAAVGTSEQEPD
jgi:hypothetical protein